MILLAGLCYRDSALLRSEFVRPVARVVGRLGVEWTYCHYSRLPDGAGDGYDAVILCGTALKDTGYLREIGRFSWLPEVPVPVLGICAGMQVLSLVHGGTLRPACEIGMEEVRVLCKNPILPPPPSFSAYELHRYSCVPPPGWKTLAVSKNCVQAVSHPELPLFGVLFHPEVRNESVIERFLSLANPGKEKGGGWGQDVPPSGDGQPVLPGDRDE
ncbi:MAG: gamma-glutamyl-gamma-aminobutyrate hydrolase family protein [Methanolinea sp.]|nr:gamma-glutamyl-gamma-aminobutyrate hydrolase family protein [Methanolinea sp.]